MLINPTIISDKGKGGKRKEGKGKRNILKIVYASGSMSSPLVLKKKGREKKRRRTGHQVQQVLLFESHKYNNCCVS